MGNFSRFRCIARYDLRRDTTMSSGRYPREYNPKVHGPYMPGRYYGKPDTPFGQVKLGELGSWFGRRNKGIDSMWSSIHRAYWRWAAKNLHVRSAGFVPYGQACMALSAFYFVLMYGERKYHRHCKYH